MSQSDRFTHYYIKLSKVSFSAVLMTSIYHSEWDQIPPTCLWEQLCRICSREVTQAQQYVLSVQMPRALSGLVMFPPVECVYPLSWLLCTQQVRVSESMSCDSRGLSQRSSLGAMVLLCSGRSRCGKGMMIRRRKESTDGGMIAHTMSM